MARIVWSDAAESFLLGAPPTEAERIFAAIEQMANARRGFVRRMQDGAGTLGLYLTGYVILFHLAADGTIHIDLIRERGEP
jgi:hypothetical protein